MEHVFFNFCFCNLNIFLYYLNTRSERHYIARLVINTFSRHAFLGFSSNDCLFMQQLKKLGRSTLVPPGFGKKLLIGAHIDCIQAKGKAIM